MDRYTDRTKIIKNIKSDVESYNKLEHIDLVNVYARVQRFLYALPCSIGDPVHYKLSPISISLIWRNRRGQIDVLICDQDTVCYHITSSGGESKSISVFKNNISLLLKNMIDRYQSHSDGYSCDEIIYDDIYDLDKFMKMLDEEDDE